MSTAMVKIIVYPDRSLPYWARAVHELEVEVTADLIDQLPEIARDLAEEVAEELKFFKKRRRSGHALAEMEKARHAAYKRARALSLEEAL